jgi:hypothetical protein
MTRRGIALRNGLDGMAPKDKPSRRSFNGAAAGLLEAGQETEGKRLGDEAGSMIEGSIDETKKGWQVVRTHQPRAT